MNRKGKLLIANPLIPFESPWHKTVIFIYESSNNGDLGVILNKRSKYFVKDLCNQKGILFDDGTQHIYQGGPVASESIVMLHTNEWQSSNTLNAGSKQRLSSDEFMFQKLSYGDVPAWYRVCAGICSWKKDQLDMELTGRFPYTKAHRWLVCTPNDDTIYGYDEEEQWDKALERATNEAVAQMF